MQENPEPSQDDIDEANAKFWNTLCGSSLAKMLGVTDDQPESLKRFDDWYMSYYPYLTDHVPVNSFANKKVLEIGLGYGTLSQKIAEAGADYLGMDIALGPVSMVKHRLKQMKLPGDAIQRSFLENRLPDESFDSIVAIGCFHHTGNVQGCIDETFRLLKPKGTAHLMVYNRYSHRRWVNEHETFIKELVDEEFGFADFGRTAEHERAASDTDLDGNAAPETAFLSRHEFERRLGAFSTAQVQKENMDESMEPSMDRKDVLGTWGKRAGLDLYAVVVK